MTKMNVIISTVNGKFDLNGLPISLRGTTAYRNVYFGADTGRIENPKPVYVAIVGLNTEEQAISGKKTFIWHLSKHDNVLDAAYVAMKFNENRAENVLRLRTTRTGEWDYGTLPVFEYPAIETAKTLAKRVKSVKSVKSTRQTAKKVETITLDNRSADANFDVLYAKYNIPELLKKFSRDTVLTARKALTINEFELRFSL
jgi:hypothetical protein